MFIRYTTNFHYNYINYNTVATVSNLFTLSLLYNNS